jgi:methionyl-tRNA synthetase
VACERFFTEKDLSESGACPDCSGPTTEITESNYFFRMSRYQDWLVDHIKSNPGFIQPAFRANETLGFLKNPLEDLCVSRPKSRLAWGIELPFDRDYVCYVWFDALINYISGVGYGRDEAAFKKWWPASCHLIGKDILTTHSVYWPTMLKAIGVELPEMIFAHGWWLSGGSKMSKSKGNVVNPMGVLDKYGDVDAFRYHLVAEMSMGQDAAFSEEAFVTRYNSDLANDLGNLLSRVIKMILRNFGGSVPPAAALTEAENELRASTTAAAAAVKKAVEDFSLEKAASETMSLVRAANRYFDKAAPWQLAKTGDTARLGTVLSSAAAAVNAAAVLLHPIMPGKTLKIRETLGFGADSAKMDLNGLPSSAEVRAGQKVSDIDALFKRIETAAPETAAPSPAPAPAQPSAAKTGEALPEGVISIDDFSKVKLRTAKVLEAENVKGADKLLRLMIDDGEGRRQIVAGVAQYYTPEQMLGRSIVIVANLKPAKIRGIESNGMLLAAKTAGVLKLVAVDGEIPSGASVG